MDIQISHAATDIHLLPRHKEARRGLAAAARRHVNDLGARPTRRRVRRQHIDDQRSVDRPITEVARRRVDVQRRAVGAHARAFVYMPEDVHARPHSRLHLVKQIEAPCAVAALARVAVAERRAVRQ